MKLIIDIPEEEYKMRVLWAKSDNLCSPDTIWIAKGLPCGMRSIDVADGRATARPQDNIFPMKIVAGKCPIEAGGNCPLRTQGEWIYKEFDIESGISHSYWCSNCGEPKSQWCDDFCQRCGADMRKGGAE